LNYSSANIREFTLRSGQQLSAH